MRIDYTPNTAKAVKEDKQYTRPVTRLGHQEGEEFSERAQIFYTMSSRFEVCPKHFSRGSGKFSSGGFPLKYSLLANSLASPPEYDFKKDVNRTRTFMGNVLCDADCRKGLCGVEKRFFNIHCIVSNLKRISKMSTLAPWKNFCGRPRLCSTRGPHAVHSKILCGPAEGFIVGHT